MKDWSKLVVQSNTPLSKVLDILNTEVKAQVVLVTNDYGELLGTITDGDVRRALLAKYDINAQAKDVMFTKFCYADEKTTRDEKWNKMELYAVKQIPILNEEKHLIGLELLDELDQIKSIPNPVLIMAGGLGSRLKPLTDDCPKPMLKVGDKPILEVILVNMIKQGFENFYFSINYLGETIQQYFKNGERWGVKIQYLHEKKRLGTAGAISLLPVENEHSVLVMNGDVLSKVDGLKVLEFHQYNKSDITVCLRGHKTQVPYGVAVMDGISVVDLIEKPVYTALVSAGIYVVNQTVISHVNEDEYLDMPELIKVMIEKEFNVHGFPMHEYWLDIGLPEQFKQAQLDIKNHFDG